MASLFMNIGNGNGPWCSKYDSDTGKYIECAPSSYQISVGTRPMGNSGPYWEWYIMGWYQGCWFIENPMPKMLRSHFIELMTEVGNSIRSKYEKINDNCPAFTGETFVEIYPKLVNCMDEIIGLFIKKTGNENWCYLETYGK